MPQGRPAIPIEIKRQVLFQARYRCAVCCEPTPLQQAHIRPWSASQDHTAANLIALCANCHQRADTEKWGTAQLHRYKEEPCALQRDRLPPLSPFQKALVDMIIGTDPEKMTENERLRLVAMIAAYADVRVSAVSVVSVEPANSTRIRLDLPSEAAEKLIAGFQSGDLRLQAFLDNFALLRIEPAPKGPERMPSSMQPRPLLDLESLLCRLKDGADQDAWKTIFDTYRPFIYMAVLRAGLNPSYAEDVAQEALASVYNEMTNYVNDPGRASFRTWLYRLTWRSIDHVRKRPQCVGTVDLSPGEDTLTDPIQKIDPVSLEPDVGWERDWEENLVAAALERVKKSVRPAQFRIYDYYVVQGKTVAETTEALGVSPAQVYKAKVRVGKVHKQQLAQLRRVFL